MTMAVFLSGAKEMGVYIAYAWPLAPLAVGASRADNSGVGEGTLTGCPGRTRERQRS